MKYITFGLILFILSGCTYKGVYEGIQTGKQNECYQLPKSQQQTCLENSKKTYEEYEYERKTTKN